MLSAVGRPGRSDEAGSTLVATLIVMLVLTAVGLVIASIVVNSTSVLVGSRSVAQARGAADAGLAELVSRAQRGTNVCRTDPYTGTLANAANTVSSTYSVRVQCGVPQAGKVTMTSTGSASGAAAKVSAVYAYSAGSTGHGADMVFYGDTTFTKEVITSNTNGLLSIVIPSGGFTCQTHAPANIVASGLVKTNGGCTIDGNVHAGGQFEMTNATDLVKGNVTASGTATYDVKGKVNGDISLGGELKVGWNNFTYPGNVKVRGAVNLASASIAKSLTMPKTSTLQTDGYINTTNPGQTSRVAGGIVWKDLAEIPVPTAPVFDPWFDFTYSYGAWVPFNGVSFNQVTLATTGNGPWTCDRFMQNNPNTSQAAGWRELGDLTVPTIVDARPCGVLSTNNGSTPNVTLQTDVVLLAKSINLTTVKFTSKVGITARVWFIVEDGLATGAGKNLPSCTNGAGNIELNSADMAGVNAMVYTPCTIAVQGNSKWHGAFYGGAFSYGGGMTFVGDNISLPGMPSSPTSPGAGGATAFTLGALESVGDTK